MNDLICGQLTEKIIGAMIEVHKHLGPGLLESSYEQCLCWELTQPSHFYPRTATGGVGNAVFRSRSALQNSFHPGPGSTAVCRRIRGGGCWGSSSPSVCKIICCSASGSVCRGSTSSRPSVVGITTSSI